MANSVADGEILEGFLCPICMHDLETLDQLQEHVKVSHSTEDGDVLHVLKGFIDKAKRKILKQDSAYLEDLNRSSAEPEPDFSTNSSVLEVFSLPQDTGLTINHTQYFRKLRDKKTDRYVIETNKLLIRLDRLICDVSTDSEKRKEFEKSIVPWVSDGDVPLCPGCAKSFGISRRRHHCRLCGCVMCNSCSCFITYDFARKITAPVSDDKSTIQVLTPTSRKISSASLMSVIHAGNENVNSIRACKDCNSLLQRHDRMIETKSHKPVIVHMYEKLCECMTEEKRLVPIYMEMIESLNLGESDYQLRDAQELKVKVSKLAKKIDSQSKRILNLEDAAEDDSNSQTIKLQTAIRTTASTFLRNFVLGLPSPPTPEEFAQYQAKRLSLVQRRIELEKMHKEMLVQNKKPNISPSKTPQTPISPDTGWCVNTNNIHEDGDPMLQQMEIIKGYIKQARRDHKYEEVKMLEENLEELQLAYSKEQSLNPFYS